MFHNAIELADTLGVPKVLGEMAVGAKWPRSDELLDPAAVVE